ncbi:MAG: triose-phosphate isomerase [Phycisphaeraceae bacterium]|nr:triose-phosphate isomerase [Phycisphaeraceae bacterium]MCW5762064.1 triose-phosphate isomerase [Phycisphaeraceae bacterium]
MTRRPYVGGNWKMNTGVLSAGALARGIAGDLVDQPPCDVTIFPPFPYLLSVNSILRERGVGLRLGSQDVYHQPNGAFTGEVSAEMLIDCGVRSVLVGHSERRHVIGESDGLIRQKLIAGLDAGLEVVLCIGETLEQRNAGETDLVNVRQLEAGLSDLGFERMSKVVIAYEPVWAIGTGRTATPADAQDAHEKIRAWLSATFNDQVAQETRIIYGGSAKPANAAELFSQPDVDGGLIGGASLVSADFVRIVRAAVASRRMQHDSRG